MESFEDMTFCDHLYSEKRCFISLSAESSQACEFCFSMAIQQIRDIETFDKYKGTLRVSQHDIMA